MVNPSNPIPAMTNAPPLLERPVVIIGQQYLTQYPVDLIFPSKMTSHNNGDITDVNDTVIFKIKKKTINISRRRFLTDALGNTLVTLHPKMMSAHQRWGCFRGESTKEEDLLFSVKKSSLFGRKKKLDVFLAGNKIEQVPDFKVKGGDFIIFVGEGDSKSTIAQMHKGHNLQTDLSLFMVDTNRFAVTTYPNVDYAFITALAVVIDEINYNPPSSTADGGGGVGGGANFGGGGIGD